MPMLHEPGALYGIRYSGNWSEWGTYNSGTVQCNWARNFKSAKCEAQENTFFKYEHNNIPFDCMSRSPITTNHVFM